MDIVRAAVVLMVLSGCQAEQAAPIPPKIEYRATTHQRAMERYDRKHNEIEKKMIDLDTQIQELKKRLQNREDRR